MNRYLRVTAETNAARNDLIVKLQTEIETLREQLQRRENDITILTFELAEARAVIRESLEKVPVPKYPDFPNLQGVEE